MGRRYFARGVLVAGTAVSALVWSLASAAGAGTDAASPAVLAQIGRLMFFDPALSASGKLACATCHDPRYAYGPPPGKALAYGGRDMTRPGTRAVPSLRYLHAAPRFAEQYHFIDGDVGPIGGFTWDGRAQSLHEQARVPLLAANEMANAGPADVGRKLARSSYAGLFRAAFGAGIFTRPNRAFEAGLLALEAFQQEPAAFYPYSSKYDAYLRGELELTDQEERGAALFKNPAKGNCASCHLGVSRAGAPPPFTDFDYANVGVPRNPRIPANADPEYFDLGLCGPVRRDLAGRREYCGFFRSPTVRNSAIRDAFFHNGVFTSLREVMHFYVERDLQPQKYFPANPDGSVHKFDDLPTGYPVNIDRDPPLDRDPGAAPALTEAEMDDVVAFLQTLTDADVSTGAGMDTAGSTAPASGLDWRAPWREPQDTAAARAHGDEYAWRLFVAVNWPADPAARRADPTGRLGADRPVVWETWQNAGDVYLEDGADPGPWRRGRPQRAAAAAERFETLSLKDFPRIRHIVDGVMVPLTDPLAGARRLTEIRCNRAAFGYIRARELYNEEGQLRAAASGRPVSFPYGAKEIKATWRPIGPADRNRYHTLVVTLADGTRRLYGLTALHIASKDLPTWFWATFEHVDNPIQPDGEGWQLPSRDEFACRGRAPDCNLAPARVGLEGTVWQYYRLRGSLSDFVDAAGAPRRLANSELEAGFQTSASCITCHARASIGTAGGELLRLPLFQAAGRERRGYVGFPESDWFNAAGQPAFQPLDFVWSLSKARPARSAAAGSRQ